MNFIAQLSLAAMLFYSAQALACSCSLPKQMGFVGPPAPGNTVRHLPANAKGVLFLAHSKPDVVGYGHDGDTPISILASTPAPLSEAAFVVRRQNAHRDEALKLTRLDVDGMLALPQARYFLFKDPLLAQCRSNQKLKPCQDLDRLRTQNNAWVKHLLTQGSLTEITQEVAKSGGLFRVSPVGGFKANERYSIRYVDDGVRGANYPMAITVEVDAHAVASNAQISLEANGRVERQVVREATDGSCSHALPAAVHDDSAHVRNNAAEMLASLGPAAKAAVPALIAALKNNAKPNYQVPSALIAIAPSDPAVRQALLDRLDINEIVTRGEVATALAVAGQTDKPRTVRALLKSAKDGNLSAMEALAAFGPDAKSTVPFLLEQAQTSEQDPTRLTAMQVLVVIGDGDEKIVAAIANNLNSPTDYVFHTAIESLGKIGPKAQPALPALAALFDRNLSNYEQLTLLQTLRQLEPKDDVVLPIVRRLAKTAKDDYIKAEAIAYWQKLRPNEAPSR